MKFDEFLFSHLGEMGKYQKIQFLLVCLPTIFTALHALSWTFSAAAVPYRCALPGEEKYSPYWINTSDIARTDTCYNAEYKPVEKTAEGARCEFQKCSTVDGNACDSFVIDNSRVKQTAMGRWDIVCGSAWLKAVIQAAYYVGQMVGSLVFGTLGDKIGRKKVFFIAIITQVACGLLLAVAPTWWLYLIFRAGTGFSHPGIFVIAVVIGMEMVGPRYRKLASVITGLFFSVGQVILGTVAMLVTDYQWLHVAIAAPALLFISYWWLVPESARWLVTMRRYEEADKVLQKAAKINGVALPNEWWTLLDDAEASNSKSSKTEERVERTYGFVDLLKTSELRKRSLIIFYCWPIVSMVYYGLSMKSDMLGGDLYVNFIVGGFIEMPALLLVFLFIDRIGRRYVLATGFFTAGVCLLTNLFISATAPMWISLIQLLLSKAAITGVYAGMYTFSPELFPTVLRNTAMGICSMIARVGAISASFVSMYVVEQYGKIYMIIPFGTASVIAAVLILVFLPETMGKALPATIEEVEGKEEGTEMASLSKTEEKEKSETQ